MDSGETGGERTHTVADVGRPNQSVEIGEGSAPGVWTDNDIGTRVYYMTITFYNDDSERILNYTDEIEVGLIRPPWWTDDMEPPEWPRPKCSE